MSVGQGILLGTAIATFASFAWAILRFFTAPDGIAPGMRAIKVLGNIGAVLQFVAIVGWESPYGWGLWLGLLLYALAITVFWWAVYTNARRPLSLAYSHDEPQHVVQDGPYRFVRHPFYTAYTLAWLAGPVATGQWWLLSVVVIMFALYLRAATQEEQKFSRSAVAQDYHAYKQRTGMFFPFVG